MQRIYQGNREELASFKGPVSPCQPALPGASVTGHSVVGTGKTHRCICPESDSCQVNFFLMFKTQSDKAVRNTGESNIQIMTCGI